MIEAFSTPTNRTKTLLYLVISGLSAIAAVVVGIDDNPPGLLLAILAAIAFVLAFSHPWRATRKFMLLLLASLLGFVLFVIVSIVSDSVVQNPGSSVALKNLIESHVIEAVYVILLMILSGAFIVGVAGSVVMFIRNRRQGN